MAPQRTTDRRVKTRCSRQMKYYVAGAHGLNLRRKNCQCSVVIECCSAITDSLQQSLDGRRIAIGLSDALFNGCRNLRTEVGIIQLTARCAC